MSTTSLRAKCLDGVIEKGMIFLLIFTPLMCGSVHAWSAAVMQIASFLIFAAWIGERVLADRLETVKTPLIALMGLLVGLVLFQLMPLPRPLLSLLSPATTAIYDEVFGAGAWGWRTVSLHPGATGEELLKLLAYAAIFMVVINHYKAKEQIRPIVMTIIYMACFLVVFAIIQKLTWNGRLFWVYPLDPALMPRVSHIWGPYINHNHFAGYMEMAMPLSFGMLLSRLSSMPRLDEAEIQRKIASIAGSHRFFPAVAWAITVLLLSTAVFISLSRGAIIGLTTAVLFMIAITRTRRSLQKKTGVIMVSGAVVLLALMLTSWERVSDRFEDLAYDNKIQRVDVWGDAARITADFPVFGTGLGTFSSVYPRYQTKYPTVFFQHAENDYVEIVTDLGVPGLVVIGSMVILYLSSLLSAWSKRHDRFVKCLGIGGAGSCVAMVVHSFTDFNMRVPANAMLLTVIAGITYALVLNVRDKRSVARDA